MKRTSAISGTNFRLLILFVYAFVAALPGMAQTEEEKDSLPVKVWRIPVSTQLGDTAWWALQQKTNSEFLSLVPTLTVIKETFDSLEIKNNPQVVRLKYNYISFRVGKQLKRLQKKAKANKLKFKTCELDRVEAREGKDEKGNDFAYISLEAHKLKRAFTIKFVALKLSGNWYIADELTLEFPEESAFYRPPVKVKKKN